MGITITPRNGQRGKLRWYLRIVIYAVALVAVVLVMNALRGQIPQAFGLTPIRVDALSVARISPDSLDASSSRQIDYAVTVRIVGRDSVTTPVRLDQFRVDTDAGRFQPYASDVLFDSTGILHVARGDTIVGVLVFSLPERAEPKQLWWNP